MSDVRLTLTSLDRERWNDLAARFSGFSLVQSWEYGEAKARCGPWQVERGLLGEPDRPWAAFQALLRPLPAGLGGLAWVNRAPLGSEAPGGLATGLAALVRRYVAERGFYLRLQPAVAAEAFDAGAAQAAGLVPAGHVGWASATVDLTRSDDELRAALAQKWRNALNRAERGGLEVEHGHAPALFADFVADHGAHLAGAGFATSLTPRFLATLQRLLPEARRLEVFRARDGGGPVGAILVARYGDSGEYLAGTLNEAGRRAGAGQLLLWRAMVALKAEGLRRFDLGGLDPIATPAGIYRFKSGVGGTPYRLAPEIEAVGRGLAAGVMGRLVRWRVGRARARA